VLGSSAVGSGRPGVMSCRVWLGLAMVVVVWMLAAGGGSAWATPGHSFANQFGALGNGNGQFAELGGVGPAGVAVMASTGEVFTVDAGIRPGVATPRVQRFGADGVFTSALAIDPMYNIIGPLAVDPAGVGAVYVSANRDPGLGVVVKYSADDGGFAYELDASTSGTTLNSPLYGAAPVAVDPVDGTVYATASNGATPVIDRFDGSTGAFIDSFDGSANSPDGTPFCGPLTSLAVDGSHRVYVLDACKGRVDQYSAAGVFGATVDDGSRGVPSTVAADPVSDEVYVSEAGPVGVQITHFSAGGAGVVYTFDASTVGGVRDMAVSGAGTVYTSDATHPVVERFTRFDGPTVVTGGTSSLEARSVVLEGTIDPEGVASSYHFEYGTDFTYGSRTPEVGAGTGSSAVAVSTAVGGLDPNLTYHYRLVGSNAAGSIAGVDGSFTTGPAPASVGDSFASEITPRSASIHGTVNPNRAGLANSSCCLTSYLIEYGITTTYGQTAVGADGGTLCNFFVGCGGSDQPVVAPLSGLEPGTTYHFRVVADNGTGGVQQGPDRTFITAPAAGGGASGVTAGRATLTGTINPHGVATSYHFNYGPTSSYGASTPEVEGGSGDGERAVSQGISGLVPDRTYHVQVVATSADGVVRAGGDGVFRTAPAPTAAVIGPTGVSTDAATLAGEVNTFGSTGSYHFDVWSLDSSYTVSTPVRPVAGFASAERVSAALTGLPAGETFAVQLTVSSNDAVGVSDLATFATAAAPRVFPSPPVSDGVSRYGCGSPRLDAYNSRPKPGEMITISGQDLGVGGSVVLGDRSLKPVDWSASGFKVLVPDDAAGSLALTVNCGRRSNTIAVTLFQEPDNGFLVTGRSVVGSTATLKVRVSGPGKLESFGAGTKMVKVTIKKPGTATLKVKLSRAGVEALSRTASHTRKVAVRVRFTPAGGRSASKTVTITFKRKGAR
jgi:hypothetical protein